MGHFKEGERIMYREEHKSITCEIKHILKIPHYESNVFCYNIHLYTLKDTETGGEFKTVASGRFSRNLIRFRNLDNEAFKREYLNEPSKEEKEKHQRAYQAMLAYELNCEQKYDRPNRPSLPIPKEESIGAFAAKHKTTVKEMKAYDRMVERAIECMRKDY